MYKLADVLTKEINEKVVQVSGGAFNSILTLWCSDEGREAIKQIGYYSRQGDKWIAGDNSDGEFFVEEFDSEVAARAWLTTGDIENPGGIVFFYECLADIIIDHDPYEFRNMFSSRDELVSDLWNHLFIESAANFLTSLFLDCGNEETIDRVLSLIREYTDKYYKKEEFDEL